jgi:hypothetical protein
MWFAGRGRATGEVRGSKIAINKAHLRRVIQQSMDEVDAERDRAPYTCKAKETYYKAKETYYKAKETWTPGHGLPFSQQTLSLSFSLCPLHARNACKMSGTWRTSQRLSPPQKRREWYCTRSYGFSWGDIQDHFRRKAIAIVGLFCNSRSLLRYSRSLLLYSKASAEAAQITRRGVGEGNAKDSE